jgi:hypothetical protein
LIIGLKLVALLLMRITLIENGYFFYVGEYKIGAYINFL